eukprot:CAMPEP_0198646646 /NCGR_PEP_ID=MMETSP1467-20131203/2084_1 /TAXON_ID=1462469 /ORGANISM="unid. sp., Strain CCMP2135" /LENGTH=134 /DNA_ID=CAMNT_0044382205 /DNA_START=145 /DNA_END=545 /DNA_ORIENTATION=+
MASSRTLLASPDCLYPGLVVSGSTTILYSVVKLRGLGSENDDTQSAKQPRMIYKPRCHTNDDASLLLVPRRRCQGEGVDAAEAEGVGEGKQQAVVVAVRREWSGFAHDKVRGERRREVARRRRARTVKAASRAP